MNTSQTFLLGAILITTMLRIAAADTINTNILANKEQKLPSMIGTYEIDIGVRNEANRFESSDLRVKYLSSVILKPSVTSASDTNNLRKASAIRLLGALASTNAVGILVSNISFADPKYHDFPAVQALATIGEPAVSNVLTVVKESTNKTEAYCAVQVLKKIKGNKYQKFVQMQKKALPHEQWNRLLQYDVDW